MDGLAGVIAGIDGAAFTWVREGDDRLIPGAVAGINGAAFTWVREGDDRLLPGDIAGIGRAAFARGWQRDHRLCLHIVGIGGSIVVGIIFSHKNASVGF